MTATTAALRRVDVTMMYLIHDAARRDLDRIEVGLHRLASQPAGPARRALIRSLQRCWTDFALFLHEHQTSEDELLWPLLRRHCPMTGELLADMAAEHAAIAPLVRDCRNAMALAYTSYPTFEDARRAVAAVGVLRDMLCEHFDHEEFEALPYIAEHLGEHWTEFEDRQRKDAGLLGLTRFLPWVLDDADPIRADRVRDQVPPSVFALVSGVFLRRRQRALAPLRTV